MSPANGLSVSINDISPDASAIFDIASTTQGVLLPRMTTTEILAISSPAEGLMVYNTTTHRLNIYNGSAWQFIAGVNGN